MSALQWMKWFCIGLLAAGCALATTGCDDDDEGSNGGDETPVETDTGGDDAADVVDSGEDAASEVADSGEDDSAEEPVVDDGDDDSITVALAAPQLVSPANGAVFNVVATANVTFKWTAVPGAAAYVFELNGDRKILNGTTITVACSGGGFGWRVCARDASGANGPSSSLSRFFVIGHIPE